MKRKCKKKWKRRVLGGIFAGILLMVGMFWGCGAKEDANRESSFRADTIEEKKKLTFMCISTVNQDIMNDAIAEFNKNNSWNAEIEVTYYPNEKYKKELLRKMIAGEETDLFFSWTSGYLMDFTKMGKVMPLNYYLDQDADIWQEKYDTSMFDAVTFNGSVYAIPTTKCISVVYYNKEIFSKYHLQPPKTYEEFLNICETLKKHGITPLYMGSTPWSAGLLYLEILRGTGGNDWQTYDSAKDVPWTSKKFVQAAETMQELYKKGYVPQDFLNTNGRGEHMSDTAMYLNGDWFSGSWEGTRGIFLFPAVDPAYRHVQVGGADRSFAISADCKYPQAAYEFLKLYAGEAYQERTLYEENSIPVRRLDKRPEKQEQSLNEQTRKVERLMQKNPPNCIFMDVKYGSDFGTEFNQTAQKILAGEDAVKSLEKLQKYADEEE